MIVLHSVVLAALLGSPNDSPPNDPQPKPVADVVKGLGLDVEKAEHIDEPPGKLRGLSWSKTKLPGTTAEVTVTVEIVYTLGLFSPERKWDAERVRAATVTKVTLAPVKP
jgi:hypothetical protein